jgi:CubicO group peptidase (beta-lactamase class C family)
MTSHLPLPLTRRALVGASSALLFSTRRTLATSTTGDTTETGTAMFLELMGHISESMGDLGIPAVGVGVVDGDKRHTCALGVTNLDSPQLVDAETLFHLGPLTSLFTTSALAALMDIGALTLEDTPGSYIPSLRQAERVTIRDVAAHRTGWPANLTLDSPVDADSPARYIDAVGRAGHIAPPGDYLSYGRTSSIVAGGLVEAITGLPFEHAIKELVLSPLSMDNSAFQASGTPGMPRVVGHVRRAGDVVTRPEESALVDVAHYGLSSNLNEVLRFVAFHAFSSTPPTFISAPTRELIHRPLGAGGSVGPLRVDAMGMGWMISEFGGTQVSLLVGSHGGHSAVMAVVPSSHFGVVVLSNADFALDFIIHAAWRALDLFRGLPRPEEHIMSRPVSELRELAGTFMLPSGTETQVTSEGSGLRMRSMVDDVDASGALAFVSPLTAYLDPNGPRTLVDFVRGHDGSIGWLRYMGQLAIRTGS